MKTQWLKRIFRQRRYAAASSFYLPTDRTLWPEWVVRDIGLDDPENVSALNAGTCRTQETMPHAVPVRPVRRP